MNFYILFARYKTNLMLYLRKNEKKEKKLKHIQIQLVQII